MSDQGDTQASFDDVVNMSPAELRKWLASDDSRAVGMTHEGEKVTAPGESESVGHHMGERILEIKGRKQSELTEADYHDMRKVVGYVHRHTAQRPKGDVADTRWRKSLMNWGHDPLK
jgi:hypothetical protein